MQVVLASQHEPATISGEGHAEARSFISPISDEIEYRLAGEFESYPFRSSI
jgi:hypothetical protein